MKTQTHHQKKIAVKRLVSLVLVGILSTSAWGLSQPSDKATEAPSTKNEDPAAWIKNMSILVATESGQESEFKKDMCALAGGIAKQISQQQKATIPCTTFSLKEFQNRPPTKDNYHQIDKTHAVNVAIWRDFAGDYHVYVVNGLLKDASDVRQAEWKIDAYDPKSPHKEAATTKEALTNLLVNIFTYYQNLRSYKEFVLVNGLEESKLVKRLDNGKYVREGSKQTIDFKEAYNLYINENKRTKHYVIAAIEIGLILGVGYNWYQNHHDLNSGDWDFKPGEGYLNRIGLDDNGNAINILHARAGGFYMLAARAAGLGVLESYLVTFAASSLWEAEIEQLERISINDTFVTVAGGAAIGEVIYQFGDKMYQKLNKMASRGLIDSYGKNGFIDRLRQDFAHLTKQDIEMTGLDFEAPVRLEGGIVAYKGKTTPQSNDTEVRWYLDGEGYNIPLMNVPGNARMRLVTDTNYYRLWVEATKDPKATDTLNMIAEVAVSGYYQKSMGTDANGEAYGYQFLVAPAFGMDMQSTTEGETGPYSDMVVNVNVLGSQLHVIGQAKGVTFRIIMSVYGDFAMVQSYAFEAYAAGNDVSGAPTVLKNNGYYYAGGITGAVRMTVNYGPLEIGGSFTQDTFKSSFTNSYRYQDQITFNPTLRDQQSRGEIYAKVSLAKTLNMKCGLAMRNRSGSVNGFQGPAVDTNYKYCAMSYQFL